MTTLQKFLTDIEEIHSKEVVKQRNLENLKSSTFDARSANSVGKGGKPDVRATIAGDGKELAKEPTLDVDEDELVILYFLIYSECTNDIVGYDMDDNTRRLQPCLRFFDGVSEQT